MFYSLISYRLLTEKPEKKVMDKFKSKHVVALQVA